MGPLYLTYITPSEALAEPEWLKLMTETPWLKWADWNWFAETDLLKLTDWNQLSETVWLTLTDQGGPLEPLFLFYVDLNMTILLS